MLLLENVTIVYDKAITAVDGVSLQIMDEAIVAVLGSNGAGKSSILKSISGLLRLEGGEVVHGSIVWDGIRIDNLPVRNIINLGIVHVIEGRRVLEHLTVEENLKVVASSRTTNKKKDLDMVYEYFPILKGLHHQVSGYLSGGQQQMLVLGRALIMRPKLMLLDEPSLGLAPLIVREVFDMVKKLNTEMKVGLLIVEQNARAAFDVAENGYVLENGKVMLQGPCSQLRNEQRVQEFYLGLSSLGKAISAN